MIHKIRRKATVKDWNFPSDEVVDTIVSALAEYALNSVIEEGYKDYKAQGVAPAYFPIHWAFGKRPSDGIGGKPPEDALTVYVELPFGVDDDMPVIQFTLRDLVRDAIEGAVGPNKKIGDTHAPCLTKLRDGLLEIAEQITAALPG